MSEMIPAHDPQEEDEDDEIEVERPVYPEEQDIAEQRRAFVLENLASGEIDGRILVENCDMVARWLETGALPETKRKLKPVA